MPELGSRGAEEERAVARSRRVRAARSPSPGDCVQGAGEGDHLDTAIEVDVLDGGLWPKRALDTRYPGAALDGLADQARAAMSLRDDGHDRRSELDDRLPV